ncbi:MAG: transposase domain-containing protein [Spirochaetes bacterium]|nr:transposase domain-containing protein [Spirochaetota bacterium]MBN2770849.1 transposase domain-containing protein [Spirochaetota bacterium]
MEPYYYLRYVFEKLPACESKEELRKLLPDVVSPDMIKIT